MKKQDFIIKILGKSPRKVINDKVKGFTNFIFETPKTLNIGDFHYEFDEIASCNLKKVKFQKHFKAAKIYFLRENRIVLEVYVLFKTSPFVDVLTTKRVHADIVFLDYKSKIAMYTDAELKLASKPEAL